jgi:hypothetical protein
MYIIINSRTGLRTKQDTTSRLNIYINKRILLLNWYYYPCIQRAGPPDTILEEDHPMTILSKFGSNWATGSKQDDFYVNFP